MIMHKYGGVYADMDTECKQPIEHWAPRGCHFAVSIEHHLYFCQWAFASVPGHGILGNIIDNALRHVISREYQYAPVIWISLRRTRLSRLSISRLTYVTMCSQSAPSSITACPTCRLPRA